MTSPLTPCPIPHLNAPLAERIVRLLHLCASKHENEALFVAVLEQSIEHHFPDEPAPPWMLRLLDRLLAGVPSPNRERYPVGYPDGENGFINLLADVEHFIAPLGIEDVGEHLVWPLPMLGVVLHIEREGGDYYEVRPWEAAT